MHALTTAFNVALALAILVTVFSLGVSHDLSQLLAPLRRVAPMVLLAGVNLLVIPALAWGVATALPLTAEQSAAVTLCAVGAGGAGGLKAVQLSRVGDLPLALSSVMLLQVLNLATVPLWTHLLVGSAVPASVVLRSLAALILLPLVVALLVRRRLGERCDGWIPGLARAGTALLVLALACGLASYWPDIRPLLLGWVSVAAVLVVVVAGLLGTLVSGPGHPRRVAGGLVSAMRFTALALVLLTSHLGADSPYLAPALLCSLLELLLVVIAGAVVGRRLGRIGTAGDRPSLAGRSPR